MRLGQLGLAVWHFGRTVGLMSIRKTPSKKLSQLLCCVKIHGFATDAIRGATGKVSRIEYLCHVQYGSYEDDVDLVKCWLREVCKTDVDANPRQARQVVHSYNYVRAIVWDYFRRQQRVPQFKDDNTKPVPADPPQSQRYADFKSELPKLD